MKHELFFKSGKTKFVKKKKKEREKGRGENIKKSIT